MAAMDLLIQNAFNMLLAKMPPEAGAKLAELVNSGVELREQLNRIEHGQQELRSLLVALITALQPQGNSDHARGSDGRPAIEHREQPHVE